MYPKSKLSNRVYPIMFLALILLVLGLDQRLYARVHTAAAYPSPIYILLDTGIDLLLALTILLLFWYLVNQRATYLAGVLVIVGVCLIVLRLYPPNFALFRSIVLSTCRFSVLGYFLIAAGSLSIFLSKFQRK